MANAEVERRIRSLAHNQYGLVARSQLLDSGVGHRLIDQRVSSGRLLPVHRGVYALGHAHLTDDGRMLAAVLAAGRDSAICRLSAAAAWGLCEVPTVIQVVRSFNRRRGSRPVERTVGPGKRRLRVHRTRHLPAEDVAILRGFPVTTVERTLLDLAGTSDCPGVERFFSEACRRDVVDFDRLWSVIARGRGWRGTRILRMLLERYGPEIGLTRSDLEVRFLEECRARGLPQPLVNQKLHGLEVDFLWPDSRFVVELDGFRFHRDRVAFERDRNRDLILRAAGYQVLRLTHRMITAENDQVFGVVDSQVNARSRRTSDLRAS
jgi:very-short-patch-repair endonuclease